MHRHYFTWALLAVTVGCGMAPSPLRVCADPNNLPFSNERGEGFENKISELIAGDLGQPLEYVWWAQRRGFVRNALASGTCDVIPGITTEMESVLATRPYYRSSYVFVARPGIDVNSFDDPLLRKLRIGVQIVGDDYANTPPVHELARRGIVNVRGYRVVGDYAAPNPPARVVEAIASGEIDVAVAWGPLAGYFAARQAVPLSVSIIQPAGAATAIPIAYDIGMGVRREAFELKNKLDTALDRKREAIGTILREYGVPIVPVERPRPAAH
ncbi:MAG: substrate-binding domain-containing protein [Bryobacteraceae bacterium]